MTSQKPLCVDLDGTLLPIDTLHEALILLIKKLPLSIFLMILWLFRGKAYFKLQVFKRVQLNYDLIPKNQPLCDWLLTQKQQGRELILVSATDEKNAEAAKNAFNLFDDVISSTDKINLSGGNKAKALVDRYGAKGFDYVGNAKPDIAVWRQADKAVINSKSNRFIQSVRSDKNIVTEKVFQTSTNYPKKIIKALRVHQWVKKDRKSVV